MSDLSNWSDIRIVLTTALISTATIASPAGTCHHAYLAEGQPEPAVYGISTTDTGFTSYFWVWGVNPSDQGSEAAGLIDDSGGIAVNPGVVWANVDTCSGTVDGTGLLVEAQSTGAGGLYALVVLTGADGQIDALQPYTGQSTAEPIPVPIAVTGGAGSDAFGQYVDYSLSWAAPTGAAWALSDPAEIHAGFSLFYRTGTPVNTGDKTAFTRVSATATGSAPYIIGDSDTPDGLLPDTQHSCVVRIRPGAAFFFALSLIFDGNGATTSDRQADPSAIETTYVGACSRELTTDIDIFSDGFESGDTNAWSATSIGSMVGGGPR